MLGAIVFMCGAALMGLELLAARILAPMLGNSLYVWGSVISTVMIALSIGYWVGGQIADRWGSARTLPPVIAAAGLFTVAVPMVAAAVLPSAANLGPRLGSLTASVLIFFAPSLLMAMVSPLGVRLAASGGVERIGRSAGGLYAISTAGSIAGTIGTAFWLIPLMSIETLVVGIGFLLFATAGFAMTLRERAADAVPRGAAPMNRRELALRWATAAMIGLGLLAGSTSLTSAGSAQRVGAAAGEKVVYRKDTQYHRLVVTETTDVRNLRFDRSRQSSMSLRDPYASDIRYPDYLHLAMAARPDAKRVLVVGLGGGTLIKRMWRDYPEVRVDAVEIDPDVVDVAKRYFALPDDPRVRVTVQDGRRFIQTTDETYDVIVMDAYYDDALPFHLATAEFFREAKARLSPDGVLIYNVVSAAEGSKSRLFRSMHRTASGVFGRIWVFPIGLAERRDFEANRNIVVLATDSPLTEGELRERIGGRVDGRVSVPGFETFDEDLYSRPVEVGDVPTLTDSHAPVDALIGVN